MIKALAHKGGVRIGKTPKNYIAFVALNAEKLKQIPYKQLRPIGKGEQVLEKRLDQEELT